MLVNLKATAPTLKQIWIPLHPKCELNTNHFPWVPCFMSYFPTVLWSNIFSFLTTDAWRNLWSANWVSEYQVTWPLDVLWSNKESGISISEGVLLASWRLWAKLTPRLSVCSANQTEFNHIHPIPWVMDNMFWALMLRLLLPIKCYGPRRHVGNTLKKT